MVRSKHSSTGTNRTHGIARCFVNANQKIQAIFADVDSTPLDKWIDDFKRDLDPEGNIKIWEDMVVPYSESREKNPIPGDGQVL